MHSRRKFIATTTGLLLAPFVPGMALGSESLSESLSNSLNESSLVYISPVLSNGNLSRCQAEVWFVSEKTSLYVVTANEAWRAQAISKGLNKAKIWVGDVGLWSKSNDKYKELPGSFAASSHITDPLQHESVLGMFGSKYYVQWLKWGPKFKNGLKDGSRVMLKYELGS